MSAQPAEESAVLREPRSCRPTVPRMVVASALFFVAASEYGCREEPSLPDGGGFDGGSLDGGGLDGGDLDGGLGTEFCDGGTPEAPRVSWRLAGDLTFTYFVFWGIPGAVRYQVERPEGIAVQSESSEGSIANHMGRLYSWRVRGIDSSGLIGCWSERAYMHTEPAAPWQGPILSSIPDGGYFYIPDGGSDFPVTLNWSGTVDGFSYTVYKFQALCNIEGCFFPQAGNIVLGRVDAGTTSLDASWNGRPLNCTLFRVCATQLDGPDRPCSNAVYFATGFPCYTGG